ncbi:hypothetical protein ACHQM5_030224 [Ranunculus cassubicifolius]
MPHNSEIVDTASTSYTSIQVEDSDKELVLKIAAEISDEHHSQHYIFKVPVKLRHESNKDTYDPRIVSIGPYHRGEEGLNTTEPYKRRYLRDLTSRGTPTGTELAEFVSAIRNKEKLAREYYAAPFVLGSNEFVEMMLFDGCFILELLYKYSENENQTGKWDNDPIFGSTWMIYSLRKDLVLLENQLPFFVLENLFELTNSRSPIDLSLGELVSKFFKPIVPNVSIEPLQPRTDSPVQPKSGKHILDFLRTDLLPAPSETEEDGNNPYWEFTHSATDLSESGVKFRRKRNPDGLLDVTFTDGVLEIPPIVFGESWTILLPNLIALEQCRRDYPDRITSYVILMDSLINSQDDVKILRKKQIIDRLFHEEEKVATDINNLFKGAVADKYYYDGLCHRMNAFCKRRVHRYQASLNHDYFKTPWSILSVLAALILLALTVTQTTCAFVKCNPKS